LGSACALGLVDRGTGSSRLIAQTRWRSTASAAGRPASANEIATSENANPGARFVHGVRWAVTGSNPDLLGES
jgi:hypothetical protein